MSECRDHRAWIRIWIFLTVIAGCGHGASEELFREKCSVCHSLARPLSLAKEPAAWQRTVERMVAKAPQAISPAEARSIHAFLTHCCTMPFERLFEARCGICHALKPLRELSLSPYEWAYMIDACRSLVSAHIGVDEARRIAARLHGRIETSRLPACLRCHVWRSVRESDNEMSPLLDRGPRTDQERFLFACGCCHTSEKLTRRYKIEEWGEILERMKGKNPDWLSPEMFEPARRYILGRERAGLAPWPFPSGSTLRPDLGRKAHGPGTSLP